MSKKLLITFTALFFISGLLVISNPSVASEIDKGPEEMVIQTASAKKPAKFPHRKHQESFECKDCHHAKTDDGIKYSYFEGMEVKKCITCHNKDDMTNPKLNSFKLAAHGLCKECHKQNKDSAPTKCSGCHIK